MFERFDKKLQRIIFFARFEAVQAGDSVISPSHLLLAYAREERDLLNRFKIPVDDLHQALGLKKADAPSAAAPGDMPLDAELKQVILYAVQEADSAGSQVIEPIHMLRGLLRQPCAASAFLKRNGVDLSNMNLKIVGDLRQQFYSLTAALTPDREPAVTYKLEGRR